MEKLDYKKLQPLSANRPENQNAKAKNNTDCTKGIDTFINNYKEYLLDASVFECSSLLISENNWFNRKPITEYKDKEGNELAIEVGQVLQVDNGKNYNVECGLIHYGLIIKVIKNKVLILPMTTNRDEFIKAYHPKENISGDFSFRRGLLTEGFTVPVTLYINDLKCLSIGRLIPYKRITILNTDAYTNIREHILRYYFSDMFKDMTEKIETYKNEIISLKDKISQVKEI